MHASLRPYATTGVALVGATVIAAAPLAPPAPDVEAPPTASGAVVQMTALVNPIEEWVQVFETSLTNATALAAAVAANPAPILAAIGENQLLNAEFFGGIAEGYVSGLFTAYGNLPTTIEDAIAQIEAGDIQNGFGNLVLGLTINPFVAPALALLPQLLALPEVLSNPFENAANVVATASSLGTLFGLLPVITGVFAPVLQLGVTGQEIYDALEADDVEGVVNALISFPSDLANTVLNGNVNAASGGLIGPTGIIKAFLDLRVTLADAIEPPPVPAAMTMDTSAEGDLLIAASLDDSTGASEGGAPLPEVPPLLPADDDDATDEVVLDDVDVDDELEVDESAEASDDDGPRQIFRPSRHLEQLGDRIQQRFQDAEDRLTRTIDRLTGNGDDDGNAEADSSPSDTDTSPSDTGTDTGGDDDS